MAPFVAAAAICVGVTAFIVTKVDMNHFFMRFFRDVARSKARRRLYGSKNALIPMLFGVEEPVPTRHDNNIGQNDDDAMTITLEELASYNGENGSPLYLAIKGRVYDVSAGERFYGEDGNYHSFVGKDATRAFAIGCTKEECISSSIEGLGEKEMKEVDRWIELYETHDKYTFVGYLIDDPVDAVLAAQEIEEERKEKDSSSLQDEMELN